MPHPRRGLPCSRFPCGTATLVKTGCWGVGQFHCSAAIPGTGVALKEAQGTYAQEGEPAVRPVIWIMAVFLLAPAAAATSIQTLPESPSAPGEGVEVRLPADIIFGGATGPLPAVIFRHTTHTAFAGGQCVACHPQPFKILHPARRTSHAEMNAGRSCGICHDGRRAFGTAAADACQRCHAGGGASK